MRIERSSETQLNRQKFSRYMVPLAAGLAIVLFAATSNDRLPPRPKIEHSVVPPKSTKQEEPMGHRVTDFSGIKKLKAEEPRPAEIEDEALANNTVMVMDFGEYSGIPHVKRVTVEGVEMEIRGDRGTETIVMEFGQPFYVSVIDLSLDGYYSMPMELERAGDWYEVKPSCKAATMFVIFGNASSGLLPHCRTGIETEGGPLAEKEMTKTVMTNLEMNSW
ncbi:Uncharacterised protein [Candidatus Bilamarchaeum dharawalense]|uniref:Uncharacterized protein n=1 Tax=Candidatus Bilamarchaeum dharawalense TaxID=2885759 RepID=A0A5E4LSU1_9ARCH|nr:Uncharacterised protein [Candidatus Bilamarchaeum dharawalense]